MHSSPDLPELIRRLLSTSHIHVVLARELVFAGLVVAALAVLVSFLDRCCNFRVSGVAAHIFAPCGEAVLCTCQYWMNAHAVHGSGLLFVTKR